MAPDLVSVAGQDELSMLAWLRDVADQNVPDTFKAAAVPVAWVGRTSTDDAQDPTLSLPRQLENSRSAAGAVASCALDPDAGDRAERREPVQQLESAWLS